MNKDVFHTGRLDPWKSWGCGGRKKARTIGSQRKLEGGIRCGEGNLGVDEGYLLLMMNRLMTRNNMTLKTVFIDRHSVCIHRFNIVFIQK